MAPERYGGSGIKPSGDLYSLGIIIMEILTGQKQPQDTKDVRPTICAIVTQIKAQFPFRLRRIDI